MNETRYPTIETMNRLKQDLNLKGDHKYIQDWEIEVADVEQLSQYIDYYKNARLNKNEKATLMRIILEAYNECFAVKNNYEETIREFLQRDYLIHKEVIEYYSDEGEEDPDNWFYITPFVRSIKKQKQGSMEHIYNIHKTGWCIYVKIVAEVVDYDEYETTEGTQNINQGVYVLFEKDTSVINDMYEGDYVYLCNGIRRVSGQIYKNSPYTNTLIIIKRLHYNPCDFQNEGLIAGIMEWSAKVFGFEMPPVEVAYL